MPGTFEQLNEEQKTVDAAYARLDEIRLETKKKLDSVRAAGGHGSPTQRTERDSFAAMYEDRLARYRAVEDRLVFGRLDNTDGETMHVGRIGISDSSLDPIIIDWRAQSARPFYEATPKNHGNIALRRHITLKQRTVAAVEDEVLEIDSEHVSKALKAGTLTGEGALLASLSSRRTGKMGDIVATIQSQQDKIIRADMRKPLVVQGGPGTGKTAVALHRAAWLLYTYRKALSGSGVMVVGPSAAFLNYIDKVLPSLGETGIISRTISDIIPGVRATKTDSAKAAELKGDVRMADAVANAVKARVRIPKDLPAVYVNGIRLEILASDIEQAQGNAFRTRKPHNIARKTFVKSMISLLCRQYSDKLEGEPKQDELNDVTKQLYLEEKVRKTLNLAWLPMTGQWLVDNMFSRPERLKRFAPWLDDSQIALLVRPAGSEFTVSDIPILDEAFELLGPDPKEEAQRAAAEARRKREEEYARESLAMSGVDSRFVNASQLLNSMNGLSEDEMFEHARNSREWTFGHIVVDEAQELTAMDWRILVRRCPSRSFTIVGDVAQTSNTAGARSWEDMLDSVFAAGEWNLHELTVDYRNPREVSQLAGEFAKSEGLYVSTLEAVRSVPGAVEQHIVGGNNAGNELESEIESELKSVTEPDGDSEKLVELLSIKAAERMSDIYSQFVGSDGTGRIAVICDESILRKARERVFDLLSDRLTESEYERLSNQPLHDRQVCVVSPQDVKGLEYDAVILLQPSLIADNAASRLTAASDLYVAMTRPTQKLIIVRTESDKRIMPLL